MQNILSEYHTQDAQLIEKIKSLLFPNHSLQERVENFSSYYAIYGDAFLQDLINTFDVYHKEFLLINLNSQ